MTLYMTQFSYTAEAWNALIKSPADRAAAIKALAEKMGGRVLNLYYSFGEYDGVVLLEAPDEKTAMAILLAAIAPGHLKATRTSVLLTVEQAVEAMAQAGSQTYQAPQG